MKTTTVILSSFNQPMTLQRAIDSVLRQEDFENIELIICDDGSNSVLVQNILTEVEYSGRAKVIREFEHDVRYKMRFCTLTRLINHAMDIAKGDFITYLCDDDFYYQTRCRTHAEYLQKNEDIDLVWGRTRWAHDNKEKDVAVWDLVNLTIEEIKTKILEERNLICHCSATHRKTFVRWPTDPSTWKGPADWLYWKRLLVSGFKFFQIDFVGETVFDRNHGMMEELHNGKSLSEILEEKR
ncbi:MAG: glycosyltransferase [Candidatus Thorarchaeota archaeon]